MTTLAEEVRVTTVGELDGHLRTIVVGLHHQIEVVSLRGAGGELGVNVELTLPLRAAHAFRKGDLVAVAIVDALLVGNLRPAVVCKPVAESVEQGAVVNSLPEVGTAIVVPVHLGSIGIVWVIRWRHGAVVVGMVLQHDVRDVDVGLTRCMTEVEDELHGVKILARHVAHPEDVVLACLQVHTMLVDDGIGIGLVGQLDDHTLDVTVGAENAGEVVVVGS